MLFDKPYGSKCTELIPALADKEDKTRFISILNPTLQHYIELCLKHAKVDVSDFALLACEILCDLGVSRGVFVYNKSKDKQDAIFASNNQIQKQGTTIVNVNAPVGQFIANVEQMNTTKD